MSLRQVSTFRNHHYHQPLPVESGQRHRRRRFGLQSAAHLIWRHSKCLILRCLVGKELKNRPIFIRGKDDKDVHESLLFSSTPPSLFTSLLSLPLLSLPPLSSLPSSSLSLSSVLSLFSLLFFFSLFSSMSLLVSTLLSLSSLLSLLVSVSLFSSLVMVKFKINVSPHSSSLFHVPLTRHLCSVGTFSSLCKCPLRFLNYSSTFFFLLFLPFYLRFFLIFSHSFPVYCSRMSFCGPRPNLVTDLPFPPTLVPTRITLPALDG
ncbi:unnamed protein product [Acanthosepion pharaonis]|uniref:Transmembrane protein n=1 Tax=Acanthosepion pharaonis TaxID=158019 RepID=A0A812DQ37_ACAPH|nr:unnamed protein product [Sepia pharaonis]